jgi:hypothetical protein
MVSASKAVRMSAKGTAFLYDHPLDIPGLVFFNSYKTLTPVGAGTFDSASACPRSITFATPRYRTAMGGTWYGSSTKYNNYQGSTLTQTGYVNAGNNGKFVVTESTAALIGYVNAAGVPEVQGLGAGLGVVKLSGYCDAYTDLQAGAVMSTGGTAFAVDELAMSGGVRVLAAPTLGARALGVLDTTLAGKLNGLGPCTFFSYFRPDAVLGQTMWMGFQEGNVANTKSMVQARFSTLTDHSFILRDTLSFATIVSATLSPGMVLGAWQLLAVTFDGDSGFRWYLDGVQVGFASGVNRPRSTMDLAYLGFRASYPSGAAGCNGARAVDGAVARDMSASELVRLRDWCRAEYVLAA